MQYNNFNFIEAGNASVNYGKHCAVNPKLPRNKTELIKFNCNGHILHNAAKRLKLLSFDVQSPALKAFDNYSCAKNLESFKERFEFVQQEYHQVLKHIPVRWLTLFQALNPVLLIQISIETYLLQQVAENCIIWKFIKDFHWVLHLFCSLCPIHFPIFNRNTGAISFGYQREILNYVWFKRKIKFIWL